MMKSIFPFLIFLISCQSLSPLSDKKEGIRKKWIINTLSEPYLKTKIAQKIPTLLTPKLIVQADSLYGVRAYDREFGNLRWFFPVTGGIQGGLDYHDKRLFFGGSDGFFYSIEGDTGKILWKFFMGSESLGAPTVDDNRVYFATGRGKIYALSPVTGKTLWTYQHISTERSLFSILGLSRPALDKKNLYVGFSNGDFLALDQKTGKALWKVKLSRSQHTFRDSDGRPAVSKRFVYASSYSGGLFSLNKKTGKLVWKYSSGSSSGPVLEGSRLYYASTDKQILALNRFTGKPIWSRKIKQFATQPVIHKKFLIYGLAHGGLVILNKKDGLEVKNVNLFRGISAKPVIEEKSSHIFVMSMESWLYKLKLLF